MFARGFLKQKVPATITSQFPSKMSTSAKIIPSNRHKPSVLQRNTLDQEPKKLVLVHKNDRPLCFIVSLKSHQNSLFCGLFIWQASVQMSQLKRSVGLGTTRKAAPRRPPRRQQESGHCPSGVCLLPPRVQVRTEQTAGRLFQLAANSHTS